jgi:hypothetical protein
MREAHQRITSVVHRLYRQDLFVALYVIETHLPESSWRLDVFEPCPDSKDTELGKRYHCITPLATLAKLSLWHVMLAAHGRWGSLPSSGSLMRTSDRKPVQHGLL